MRINHLEKIVKLGRLLPAALLVLSAACSSELATEPQDRILADQAIVDGATARAALTGMYSGMQALGYYGRNFELLGDVPSDNVRHTGTFQYLKDVNQNIQKADNTTVLSVWTAIYSVISRANTIIEKVPNIADLSATEKDEILGEAYLVRALSYHNLVKFWGAVPMPLSPIKDASEAASFTRTPVAGVYTQILADLAQAGAKITNKSNTRQATVATVHAIRARVYLYQGNYAGAITEANAVMADVNTLATNFTDLFTATGSNTPEDIFRVAFTPVQYNEMGYYYLAAGRREVQPTTNLQAAFEAGDVRKTATVIPRNSSNLQGVKFPTTIGAEHLHVIRLAEVILIKAEALARSNPNLQLAVDEYNKIRVRAKLAPHALGVNVTTQADVLAAIDKERRLELALEGDRWPDLIRQGRAVAVKALTDPTKAIMPIPAAELAVVPGLGQNPGY